jgi:DNA-binding CsgD family transcriptional regulator
MDRRRRRWHPRATLRDHFVPLSPTARAPRASRPSTPLLERDAERGRIEAALARARSGRGTLTIVEGPEGIGLSALLAAARSAAEAEGMEVLRARGAELERDFAFGVVRQLFESALAEAPDAERAELLRGPAAVAARLIGLPGSDDRAAVADDAVLDSSFAALHGLHWLSANLAARRPLLLAIDDAHRADAPSLRFLHFLLARLEDLPIAIVLGAPQVERRPGDELLAGLATDADAHVVRLEPLTTDAVARLVEHGLGMAPSARFAVACQAATGGLPFFVRRLVAELRAGGVAPTDDQAARVAALGGRAMARQVQRRLHELSLGAGALAQAVAVLERAELGVAAELAGLEIVEATAAADELVAAGFLRAGRPLLAAHPVIRAAVYGELSTAQRGRGHLVAARVLAEAGAPDELVAEHLLATEPAGDRWVADCLAAVARSAARRGAPDAAAVLLRRAVAEPPAPERRAALLLELGRVEAFAGEPGWREHLPAALAAAVDDDTRVRVALTLGHTLSRAMDARAGLDVVDAALAALDEDDAARRRTLQAAAVAIGMIDAGTAPAVERRRRALRDAVDEDPATPRDLLAVASFIAAVSNEPPDAVAAIVERALAPGADRSLAPTAYPVFAPTTFALLWSGRHELLRATLDGALAQARATGDGVLLSIALTRRAWLGLRAGDLAAAEADARDAAELPAPRLNHVLAAGLLADALVEQGRWAEAEAALAPWQREAEGTSMAVAVLRSARAHLRIAQHRPNDALADLLAAGEVATRALAPSPGFLPWRSDAALARLALGDREGASRHAGEELALARASGAPRALGVALRVAGVVARGERGEALLRAAVATLDGAGAPLERARALAALGAHVRRANRRSEARELLLEAVDTARAAGALPLAAQAETDLAATGARSRSGVLGGLGALTPSERRVAGLAADGLTNRQIAQALMVTPRTVEGHLTSAFRKLDVSSRGRLAAALAA